MERKYIQKHYQDLDKGTINYIENIIYNNFQFTHIPKRFSKCRIDSVEKDIVSKLISLENPKGCFIYSDSGSGKTHFCIAFARLLYIRYHLELIDKSAPSTTPDFIIKFLPITEFVSMAKATFEKGAIHATEQDLVNYYSNLDCLILDDLGTSMATDWNLQLLFNLFDKVYRNEKIVMITSNFTIKELSDKIGDRFTSRICEMCNIFEFPNTDRRLL